MNNWPIVFIRFDINFFFKDIELSVTNDGLTALGVAVGAKT